MLSAAEAAVQRKLTAAFISADAISLVLNRRTRSDDGAGGTSAGAPAPLPAQRMRLIPLRDVGGVERQTADGEMVAPTYALLGLHNADMQRWDEFTANGHRYQVLYVETKAYEKKGEVAYLG